MEIQDTESSEEEIKGMAHSSTRRRLISPKTNGGQGTKRTDVAESPPQSTMSLRHIAPTPSPQGGFSPRTMRQILEGKASAEIAALAAEWLNGIDRRRIKSKNFHGKLSGEMKQRIEYLHDVIDILVKRSESTGNVDFLKKNNNELKARLQASEREEVRMREDLDGCERKIKDLKREIGALKNRMGYRSPSLGVGDVGSTERERRNPRAMTNRDRKREPDLGNRQG